MNPKRLIIAATLLIGLSGALWYSNKQESEKANAPSPDAPPKILDLPNDQFAKIEINRMGAEPVVLTKAAEWSIDVPKKLAADPDAANAYVATLASLVSDRLVNDATADFAPYGLKDPILTVTVTMKDGKSHKVQIGDDAPSGSATYARLAGDAKLYLVPTSTKAALEKTWRDLRDKRLLPFDSEKLTRIELGAIEFGKNNGGAWTILKPKALRADNFAAEELARKLKEARLEVVNDTEEEEAIPAKFAAAAPVGTVKVTDARGAYQLEVRKGKDNAVYAKSSAVEGVFKTSADLGDVLAKKLDDFRNKKVFEFGFTEPAAVTVKQDGQVYAFTKSGADWKKDGKNVDAAQVQQLIDRLRDLSATKFAETAAGAVVAEYTVAKEQVTVAKQGETYLARRGNEPEVFVLDAAAVNELKSLAAAVKQK